MKAAAGTEIILIIGIIIAVGVSLVQLRGVFYSQQLLAQEEAVVSFSRDIEDMLDKAILSTGDVNFVYHTDIKKYSLDVSSAIKGTNYVSQISIYDKISRKSTSFYKSFEIVDNYFEDCSKVLLIKKEDKIVLTCRCYENGEACKNNLVCCSGYCNVSTSKCDIPPICPDARMKCPGAPMNGGAGDNAWRDINGDICCPVDDIGDDSGPICSNNHCCPTHKPIWCGMARTGNSRCMNQTEIQTGCQMESVLIFTVSPVISKISQSLLDDYSSALLLDGYSPKTIQLDVDSDVKSCDSSLSASSVPVPDSKAQTIIPKCIIKFGAKYAIILGGYGYINQKAVPVGTCWDPRYSNFYSDDWYADTNGDSNPDIPLGRIPDGVNHNDDVIRNYITNVAIPFHKNQKSFSVNSKYGFIMPGWDSEETFISKNYGQSCGSYPTCYYTPPDNGGGATWSQSTNIFYLCNHGGDSGYQQFQNDNRNPTVGPAEANNRDWTSTFAFLVPCYGGRIQNVNLADSFVLTTLNKGILVYLGGTATQWGARGISSPCQGGCTSCLYDLIYTRLSVGSTVGDAYKNGKTDYLTSYSNSCSSCGYRIAHQTQFYGDPTIKIK